MTIPVASRYAGLVVAAAITALTGCASVATVESPDGGDHDVEGVASWYGEQFHGRQTASGETFDMHSYTAAHRTLPFGTRVRVRTVDTRKTVVVRITDRGPYADGRVIDLSYAAAQQLGIVDRGVADVELEVVEW